MDDGYIFKTIDDLFADFQPEKGGGWNRSEYKALTLWIPLAYHKKYRQLQSITHQEFGARLRFVIMRIIDKIESDLKAESEDCISQGKSENHSADSLSPLP